MEVTVLLLEVEQELADWPEKGERERRWLSPSQAALDIMKADWSRCCLVSRAPRDPKNRQGPTQANTERKL